MRRNIAHLWPFLWLLCVWAYVVIPFSLASGVDLGETNQLFTVLLLLHASLYLLSCTRIVARRWHWLYIVLQDMVVVGISLIVSPANALIVSIGLYLALVGESMILHRDHEVVTLTVVSAVASFMIGIAIRGGWIALHHAIPYVAPVILVAAGYIALSLRLARANRQSRSLFQELQEAHTTLTCYAARVEDLTRTNERQRMARELHDTLAQGLAGLTMQLDAVDALLSENNIQEAQEIVQLAMTRSRATLVDARKAIDDLHNTDTLDCLQAVQQELLHFTTTTGISYQADLTALAGIVSPFHEHVLRVVSECLWNVAQHAQARQVWVQSSEHESTLTIEIRDDGIGFDPSRQITHPGHYGLPGLRERARLLGGHLEIESTCGIGTTVRLTLPTTETRKAILPHMAQGRIRSMEEERGYV